MSRLNIGAGESPLCGYQNLDIREGVDALTLPFDAATFDEVRASHMLEHLGWDEVPRALWEWRRVLKPGGKVRIAVPDVAKCCRLMQENSLEPWERYLMGGQVHAHDFHKSCFTAQILAGCLLDAGFSDIRHWVPRDDETDTCQHPVSLRLEATKP